MMLEGELRSFGRSLRSANKSPKTIEIYETSVRRFAEFHEAAGTSIEQLDDIRRAHVEDWLAHLHEDSKPNTVLTRFRGLQQFFKWAVDREEIEASPMARMRRPIVPEEPVDIVERPNLDALLATLKGKDFLSLRDRAIITFLFDTGVRRSEILGLRVEDIDFDGNRTIVHGKGRRQRNIPFGDSVAEALDRYLRARSKHRLAKLDALWITRNGALSENGIAEMLWRRGQAIGIDRLHAHQFRHTFADTWLSQGGNEGDLMSVGGWRSRDVMHRYGSVRASDRGMEAHRRLSPMDNLGRPA